MHQELVSALALILGSSPKSSHSIQGSHFELEDFLKMDYQKFSNLSKIKLKLSFLDPVAFYGHYCEQQQGPWTSYHSLFRLPC